MKLIAALLLSRVLYALYGIISDCDETFNYWEPLNLLLRGFGKQTWEYSPLYSIRSWSFLLPFYIVSLPFVRFVQGIYIFYYLRMVLLLFTLYGEVSMYRALQRYNSSFAKWYLFFAIVSTGMSHSSISLLPSSIAMNCITLAEASFISYLTTKNLAKCYQMVFWFSIGGLTGWPFILVLVVPNLIYILLTNKSKVIKFLFGSLFIGSLVLSLIVYIDSLLYSKLTIVPLNAVLYNVFSSEETGPNIFGTEPPSYYLLNLLLNFNLILILALASIVIIPLISLFELDWNALTLMLPLPLWLTIFVSQPHKEERFLYPIYPFILLSSGITFTRLSNIWYKVLSVFRFKKIINSLYLLTIGLTVILIGSVSILRTIGLIQHYSSPLTVYSHLPSDTTRSNVCVGREWYHYPNSFFLDQNQRLKFVKSGFNGILPGDFKESDYIIESTSSIPPNMNNRNLFEDDKIIEFIDCHYYVDIDKEVDPEATEVQVIYGDDSCDNDWEILYCDKFIDIDKSYGIARILYLPRAVQKYFNTEVSYYNYCLAKRKGFWTLTRRK